MTGLISSVRAAPRGVPENPSRHLLSYARLRLPGTKGPILGSSRHEVRILVANAAFDLPCFKNADLALLEAFGLADVRAWPAAVGFQVPVAAE